MKSKITLVIETSLEPETVKKALSGGSSFASHPMLKALPFKINLLSSLVEPAGGTSGEKA